MNKVIVKIQKCIYRISQCFSLKSKFNVFKLSRATAVVNTKWMLQMIDELSGRLEKRESQLLAVSKDKARLEEECDNLKE